MIRVAVLLLIASATIPAAARGGGTTYYFGVAQNRTNITFESKADVETIIGTSQVVEGSATIDWDAGTGRVALSVPVASLRTGIDMRDEHLRSENWMNAAKYPTLEFKGEKATLAKPSAWTITGAFSCHGVSKDLAIGAEVKQIPAAASKALGGGDWVRVRTRFDLKLSDYGVKVPEMSTARVNDTWKVTIDLFATTEAPKEKKVMPESEKAKAAKAPDVKVEGSGVRYKFGTAPHLTTITAESATDLETIIAATSTVSGAAIVESGTGNGKVKLSVPVASLRTGIEMRDEHLRSAYWFDAEKFPEITFESTKTTLKADGSWIVEGNFAMHGVSKTLTVTVEAKEISADLMTKSSLGKTPGLKIHTTFKVKLSEYGVKVPDMAAVKVQDEWAVSIDAVAISE